MDGLSSFAIIPGISLGEGDSHAFIQVISFDEEKLITEYFRFPVTAFSYEDEPFAIRIGENRFSKTEIQIELKNDALRINGRFDFGELKLIKRSLKEPNVMGGFGYLPFMECYHGVISMGHTCSGMLSVNGIEKSFQGGRGYIEKDWGRSFPKEYVWIQSNHFTDSETGCMLSVANIPFAGTAFKGFICIANILGREYRFATYNLTRITKEEVSDKRAFYRLERKRLVLEIASEIKDSGILVAPKDGHMSQTIKEGLSGQVRIKLLDINGKVLYEDIGLCAGVEIVK